MSSSPFRVVEHVVPCQHLREYPAATANEQEQPLHLAVKQYIPLDNPNPQPGDVTILAAHANGFPKVRLKSGISARIIAGPVAYNLLSEGGASGRLCTQVQSSMRLTEYRSYTSLFGRRFTPDLKPTDSEFEASGWPMSHMKARAA